MTTIKTAELIGTALDWVVAKCEGYKSYSPNNHNYSTCWNKGGPIIEREKIATDYDHDIWNASTDNHPAYYQGHTPLEAAMRCYVASKLGDTVEIPEEIL